MQRRASLPYRPVLPLLTVPAVIDRSCRYRPVLPLSTGPAVIDRSCRYRPVLLAAELCARVSACSMQQCLFPALLSV